LLTTLGGALGLSLAWLVISRGDPTNGLLPLFSFPARDLLAGLAISIVLGLVTGIFPALQAMRLRVADALRRM
jgi:putative ABC transport system permease protein